MILSETDGKLFYQLWFPLLGYASCAFGFVESASELVTPSGVDAIVARMAADELWNHVEISDDYLAQRNDLPAEHQEIINSWKRRVRGNFFLERHLKHGSILIDAEENISLTKKYDIMQAPTLVAVNDLGAELYPNASNIIRYVNEKTRA